MWDQEVGYSSELLPATEPGVERRGQSRFEVKTEVQLVLGRGKEQIIVRTLSLGWGGASLLLPDAAVEVGESVSLEFPWTQGASFAARGDVVWRQPIEGRRCLIGVRFSELLLAHEERLAQLLSLLAGPGRTDPMGTGLAERIEIEFIDRDDLAVTLEEICTGRIEITSFRPYELGRSLQLVVSRVGSRLSLPFRVRVIEREPLSVGPEGSTGLSLLVLALEHPNGDLERSVGRVIARLNGAVESREAA